MHDPIRLTIVMTHPVQYFAPWFRYIATNCPEIGLTVVYATGMAEERHDREFGLSLKWDVPLMEGYTSHVVRPGRPSDELSSEAFGGLDVPEIGTAILETAPDVALVPGWHSKTLAYAIDTCRRYRIPILYRGDSNLLSGRRGWMRPLRALHSRRRLRKYSGFLAVGTAADRYLTRMGIAPATIFRSPHAVDNEFFAQRAAAYEVEPGRAPHSKATGRNALHLLCPVCRQARGEEAPPGRRSGSRRAEGRRAPLGGRVRAAGGGVPP